MHLRHPCLPTSRLATWRPWRSWRLNRLNRPLLQRRLDPAQRLFHVRAAIERADAEVTLTSSAEAAAGGADDVGLAQQVIEELPAGGVAGRLQPDVGGVDAAEDG